MNTQDLFKLGTNVSITLNVKDLQEVINYTISATRKELEQIVTDDKTESYLTPKQVSQMLGVDTSTLWRWNKRGYLIPIEIGGKRRYPKSVIKKKFRDIRSDN